MTIQQNPVAQQTTSNSGFQLTKRQKKDLREAIVKNVNEYFHRRKGGEIETLWEIEKDLTKLNPADRDGEIKELGVTLSYKDKLIEAFKNRRIELDAHHRKMSRNN